MKQTYKILAVFFSLFLCGLNVSAQFVLAQDTVRGHIDFCPRLGDWTNRIEVPNGSVFYMYPPDLDIDPWRYVDLYTAPEKVRSGYIRGSDLMRVDDYDIIEVEKISSHGTVSFRGDNVKVNIAVSAINPKDVTIKKESVSNQYTVNGKIAKGVSKTQSPLLKYQSITVSIKGRAVIVPRSVYEHLLNPEIDNMVVYYDSQKQIVYISAVNSGVEVPYNALWKIPLKGKVDVYIFDFATKKYVSYLSR